MAVPSISDTLRPAVLGGAFACLGLPACAQQAAPMITDQMVFVEAGLFCPRESSGREEAPGTERGYIDVVSQVLTVDFDTTVVPGEVGIGFGIRFHLPQGMGVSPAVIVTTHPPFGSPPVTQESYVTTVQDDYTNAALFTFDFPYEVALGTWTLSVKVNGETVLSQSFTVVPPNESPIRAAMCEGPAMMS